MTKRKKTAVLCIALCLCALLAFTGCTPSTSRYSYERQEVSSALKKAGKLYKKGSYKKALKLYLQIMEEEPKSMDARLGAVRAELALEDYESASRDLAMAALVDPKIEDIYELYSDIGRNSGSAVYSREATSLALKYGQSSALAKVPEPPEISLKSDTYDHRCTVELSTSMKDAKIMYRLTNEDVGLETGDGDFIQYSIPLILGRGTTRLDAFVIYDGIASMLETRKYELEWEPQVVQFSDPLMEQIVRDSIGKADGVLTDEDLDKVKSVYVDGTSKLSSLDDVIMMSNLTDFSAYDQDLKDLSAFKNCPYLCYLSWDFGKLKSIEVLNYIPNLNTLYVYNNEIEDISAVANHTNLRSLDVSNNRGEDLTLLEQSKTITYLELDESQVGLASYPEKLTTLTIDGFGFDRAVVSKLTSLGSLRIWPHYYATSDTDNTLSNLSFLENLTNLDALYLSNVEDPAELSHVTSLTNLKTLTLNDCAAGNDENAMKLIREALPDCTIKYE